MVKRKSYTKNILISLAVAIVAFVFIFLIINVILLLNSDNVDDSQKRIEMELKSFAVERRLFESSCEFFNPYLIADDLEETGVFVSMLEKEFGKNDPKVNEQKKFYTLLEIEHFLSVKEYNQNCKGNFSTILFFYSNQEEYGEKAEEIGFILSTFKNKNPNLMIYSFDYDLDYRLIELLKEKYEIRFRNVIIINENEKIHNLNSIDELKDIPTSDLQEKNISIIRLN